MSEIYKNIEAFHPKTRTAWRKWLEKNHKRDKPVWLIINNKGSDTKSVRYDEAVEEALCFGWIDSVVYKRDTESKYQYFSKRKPKSVWSKSNRERVKKLTGQGLMTESGKKMVNLAKKTGTWNALKDVERMIIPDDLKKALEKNSKAGHNFYAFSPSPKKIILYWIKSAKRPETRNARIKEVVKMAAKNLRARLDT